MEPTLHTATTVGQRIRAAYLAAGLSRSAFARALGVAITTVIGWEKGDFEPKRVSLEAIEAVTGVSVEVLQYGVRRRSPVEIASFDSERKRRAFAEFLATQYAKESRFKELQAIAQRLNGVDDQQAEDFLKELVRRDDEVRRVRAELEGNLEPAGTPPFSGADRRRAEKSPKRRKITPSG